VSDDRGSGWRQFGMVNSELRIAFFPLATADCLLLTADCLLHLRGVRACGTLRLYHRPRQDVTSATERRNGRNFKKVREPSGNIYENKGWLWKTLGRTGNVHENKGDTSIKRECC
jgi:hypothetical protein